MSIFRRRAAVLIAAATICVAAPATAAAVDDTNPPTVPQNVRSSVTLAAANPVVSWDPSTDSESGVFHYWVVVDGQPRAKPSATHYDIQQLVDLDRITPGPHVVTIVAVDHALNRSAPSDPINIVVQ